MALLHNEVEKIKCFQLLKFPVFCSLHGPLPFPIATAASSSHCKAISREVTMALVPGYLSWLQKSSSRSLSHHPHVRVHQADMVSSCLSCSFVFVKNDRFLKGSVLFLLDPRPLAGFLICMVLLHYILVRRDFIKFL